jgi:hypothetical protein
MERSKQPISQPAGPGLEPHLGGPATAFLTSVGRRTQTLTLAGAQIEMGSSSYTIYQNGVSADVAHYAGLHC